MTRRGWGSHTPVAPRLVLGPVLRYVSETEATVWVEVDRPCEVEVLDHRARTFSVCGHHYALVPIDGLEPGSTTPYEVALDGDRVWPEPDGPYPPSVIRTPRQGEPLRLLFGSCRVSVPHEEPYTLPKDDDPRGRELDALYAVVLEMVERPAEEWPHALLLLGDQVYADEVSPATCDLIRDKRDTRLPPYEEVADYEEYASLYRESWSDPPFRWLISTVSTSMIFDDHDVHDDWNTSWAWVLRMRAEGWWDERIVSGISSYWAYQHLGNLSPRELADDELFNRVCDAEDATEIVREFAFRADRTTDGAQWSYCRDLDGTRIVVIDSRAGRVLEHGRKMIDEAEWRWVEEHVTGGVDHLVVASSLPVLLIPGMHWLEAWNEAVCAGGWGRAWARAGEWLRQRFDFEHWAAFDDSFERLTKLLADVGAGRRGPAPETITILSGDVHHAYLAEVAFRRDAGVRSAVHQAVCSPVRNPLDTHEKRAIKLTKSRLLEGLAHRAARSAGAHDPIMRWRLARDDEWFDNQVGALTLDGPSADLRIEKAVPGEDGRPALDVVFERRLA